MIKFNPVMETVRTNKHLQSYVAAGSNLIGTPNARKAERLANQSENFIDKNTFDIRVNSFKAAKVAPVGLVADKAAKTTEAIIPENSINFFG